MGFFKPSKETVGTGGGAATGLSEQYISEFLGPLLFGPDPVSRTTGTANTLAQLIQGRDISGLGESLQSIIQQDIQSGAQALRERYTAGGTGTSAGTPTAVAEAKYRAEAVPRGALALGELQSREVQQRLQALLPLLSMVTSLSGRGIPQAEETMLVGASPFSQLLDLMRGAAEMYGNVKGGKQAGQLPWGTQTSPTGGPGSLINAPVVYG